MIKPLCVVLLYTTFCVPVFAREVMQLEWQDGDEEIQLLLKESSVFEDGISFINKTFRFDRPLKLIVGTDDGPLYDPQADTIQMPYEFYTQAYDLFSSIVPDDEPDFEQVRHEYTIDTMLHTLFHEYGHAVIDQFEIPVVGREEDAVDALASVLLIEYYDNGADMALNAAELFALEGEERGSLQEEDFWGEHSLDEQRYYSTLCYVYGSDPDQYKSLVTDELISSERAEQCEYEYDQVVNDWDTLLEPALR